MIPLITPLPVCSPRVQRFGEECLTAEEVKHTEYPTVEALIRAMEKVPAAQSGVEALRSLSAQAQQDYLQQHNAAAKYGSGPITGP